MQRLLLLLALLALLAPAASAATLTVSASASGDPGGSPIFELPGMYIAALPQFDPSLGELQSVEFTVHAYHTGTFTFWADGNGQRARVDYVDFSYEVNAFGGSGGNLLFLPWVTPPTPDDPFGLPPGHWNLPLTPAPPAPGMPAGTVLGPMPFDGHELDYAHTYLPGPPEFAAFIGIGTLPVEIKDWALFSVTTYGGNNHWSLDDLCGINVTATYTYLPPTPVETKSWGAVKDLFR
jgi:hypothetical protein